MYGTDASPDVGVYRRYYRFLETRDEYFSSSANSDIPGNGRWMIYGLDLPDDVLQKVYYQNAHDVISGTRTSGDS